MGIRNKVLLAGAAVAIATGTGTAVSGAAALEATTTDTQSRAATIEDLAKKISDSFVFPDAADRYAATLRANLAAGKYDAIADKAQFTKQVTDDLLAVAFDGHLKLLPHAPQRPGPQPQGGSVPQTPSGVERQARLTGKIAYIRFGHFLGLADDVAAARKFMLDNADAETIIFDIRTHRGGGLAEMDAMFPYLFEKPTALVQMETRSAVEREQGNPLAGSKSLRLVDSPDTVVRREHVATPAADEKRLFDAKVYVLTSGRSGSAAEHFALALKRTGRATLIGERTYGAGHYGGFVPIEGGFAAFIPVGRTFDPDTGKGWDDIGVQPNVSVPAGDALVEALTREGVAKDEAQRLSAANGPKPEDVTPVRKRPA